MIVDLAPGRLDEVRDLWIALREHHRRLPDPAGFAIRDADSAWIDWRKAAMLGVTFGEQAVLVSGEDEFGPWDGMAHVILLPTDGPRPMLEPSGRHGELNVLSVAEGARGGGVGAALTDAAAAWLRAREAVAMHISVRATNEGARRFYASRGAADAFVTMVEDLS